MGLGRKPAQHRLNGSRGLFQWCPLWLNRGSNCEEEQQADVTMVGLYGTQVSYLPTICWWLSWLNPKDLRTTSSLQLWDMRKQMRSWFHNSSIKLNGMGGMLAKSNRVISFMFLQLPFFSPLLHKYQTDLMFDKELWSHAYLVVAVSPYSSCCTALSL